MIEPYFISEDGYFTLYKGNCVEVLSDLDINANMIFADPPYFLSGGGTTCYNGKRTSVNKAKWDKKTNIQDVHTFNKEWISKCVESLDQNGTIWISGTHHNIYSVGHALQELDMKILNNVTWQKTTPPPNLSCRYFTHSTETILWATRKKSKYIFHYSDMKKENGDKQMKDVWVFGTPKKSEKAHGKHPTQKPVALLDRIIRVSTNIGDLVLDPLSGSSTTGIVAYKLGRRYMGIEKEEEYLELSKKRFMEIVNEERSVKK